MRPSPEEPYGESSGRADRRGEICWTMDVSQSMRVPSGRISTGVVRKH